eukprot:TRINITY_DN8080_c0_g1_i1.p1 TRINITY_DN8080_c0_g1~~TRINITY_DN8080_c0_g1_i1.p1  ORF type:complete len:230 (-),score=43.53 TRINITY_DN8080_c0_g1_i1:120-809(-)
MKHWVALEANPEVLTRFIQRLGVPGSVEFVDIYGTDPELLAMVPQPVYAALLLLPIKDSYRKYCTELAGRIEKEGQVVSDKVYFTRQTIGNACGTIGMIHCILNNVDKFELGPGFFQTFLDKTKALDPKGRADALVESDDLEQSHQVFANEGQSRPPQPQDDIDLHFVAFVHHDGHLYELDGVKPFPINHGPTTQDNLLTDAIRVMKTVMDLEPAELRYTMVALVKTQE